MTSRPIAQNERSRSTTYAAKFDRMRSAAARPRQAQPAKRTFRGVPRRNPRERLTITITYRGGSSAWYSIEARGRSERFMGVVDLHTVMTTINGSWSSDGYPSASPSESETHSH